MLQFCYVNSNLIIKGLSLVIKHSTDICDMTIRWLVILHATVNIIKHSVSQTLT